MPSDWEPCARQMFYLPDAQVLRTDDPGRGITRLAFTDGGRVLAALFVSPSPVAVAGHRAGMLGRAPGIGILAGQPGADLPDPGAVVCACFDVGSIRLLMRLCSRV